MDEKEFLEFLKKQEQIEKQRQNQEQEQERSQENGIEPGTPPQSENSPFAEEDQNSDISNTPEASENGEEEADSPLPNSPSPNEPSVEEAGEQKIIPTVLPKRFPEKLKAKDPKKDYQSTTTIQIPTLSDTILTSELKQKSRPHGGLLLLLVAFTTITYVFHNWREREENKNSYYSFFLTTNMAQSELKLGEFVVFTEYATKFQEELELDVLLEPYMIGKIIGILNEAQRLVILEVFPRKKYNFRSNINFITPFIYLDDLEGSSFYKFVLFIENLFETFQEFFLKY